MDFPGMAARAAVIGVSLLAWFWSQGLIAVRRPPKGRIDDGLHDLTAPLNAWLNQHRAHANAVLIVTSAFIDLFALYLIMATLLGPTLRPFLGLLLLFLLRQACQAVVSLPEPRGMIWHRPPVPSLLVTYGVATDLFFSGHTAIAVYGACEIARLGILPLTVAAVAVAILEAVTVLILRAHYTMDVFTGILAALFAASVAGPLAVCADAWLAMVVCLVTGHPVS
jgi:hypothetical protein